MFLVEVSSEGVGPIRQLWLGRLQDDGVDVVVYGQVVVYGRAHLGDGQLVGGMVQWHWPMGNRRMRWGERYD